MQKLFTVAENQHFYKIKACSKLKNDAAKVHTSQVCVGVLW